MAENGLETQNILISSLNFATFSPQFVAKSQQRHTRKSISAPWPTENVVIKNASSCKVLFVNGFCLNILGLEGPQFICTIISYTVHIEIMNI